MPTADPPSHPFVLLAPHAPAAPPSRPPGPPPGPPERALFLAWRAGDERAGARLLRRLRPRLLAYLRRSAPDVAEDLAQDALVALVAARDTLQDAAALHAYLFTAARRIRARERARGDVPVVALDEQQVPLRLTCCQPLAHLDVVRLLAGRRSRCTATVAEYYLGGRRAPELAREQQVSESTVRSQLRHGLAQLRQSVRQ